MDDKIQRFAAMLQEQQVARYKRDHPNLDPLTKYGVLVRVKPGLKYTKVDVGTSGKYMVVNATGEIFGIKAYGVIHRGHAYGTLDTINAWNWEGYGAVPRFWMKQDGDVYAWSVYASGNKVLDRESYQVASNVLAALQDPTKAPATDEAAEVAAAILATI